ncbi:hypothetical protein LCGC14_2109300 [marine sediment metagenome]|uniref:Uncharacterized protein n=1 Tax=marine sediment metagenome TaxID=412755 RepID=A0A0F9E7J2_9ZZZZ
MGEEDNLKDLSLTELFKEYDKQLDKISWYPTHENFEKFKKLKDELLRRGFPPITKKGRKWTDGPSFGGIKRSSKY